MATEEEIRMVMGEPDGATLEKVLPEAIREEPEQAAEHTDEEVEIRAKEMGWKPDFNGPNKKSAKEFLEVGEKHVPLLQKSLKKMEAENKVLREYADGLLNSSAETIKQLKVENEKRQAELEVKKREAKENLDTDALEKVIDEQNKLKSDGEKLERAAPQMDPTVQLWAQENAGFVDKMKADPALERHAESIALSRYQELLKFPPADRLQKVMEQLIEERPDKFGNPNQQQAPKTVTMTRTPAMTPPSNDGKLSIATLPKEDRDGYDLITKHIRFKDATERKAYDERFLENYKLTKNAK